jgi:hypothetical protein
VEIVFDGSGKDAFRGRVGGARQATEPVVSSISLARSARARQ